MATHFILLCSTATSSATSGYVVVPEYFVKKEEPAGSNEELTERKPDFVPKVDLFNATVFPSMNIGFSMIILVYLT